MVQQLRKLTVPPEDLGLILIIHVVANDLCNVSVIGSDALFWPPWELRTYIHVGEAPTPKTNRFLK